MSFDAISTSSGVPAARRARSLLSPLVVLLGCDLSFVVLHLTLVPSGGVLVPLLDLDGEATIPAWYSSTKLLTIGFALFLLAYRAAEDRWTFSALASASLVFVAMSLDEIVGIHERLGFVVDLLVMDRTGSRFHATGLWFVVLGVPVVAFLGFLLWRSAAILGEAPGTNARLLFGCALFFFGALFVEALTNGAADLSAYRRLVAVEEGLELAGLSFVLWAVLLCLLNHPRTASVMAPALNRSATGAYAEP